MDPTFHVLAYSADEGDAAAWASATEKIHQLTTDISGSALPSGGYTITSTGLYYYGLYIDRGTGGSPVYPTFAGHNISSGVAANGIASALKLSRATGVAITPAYPPTSTFSGFSAETSELYAVGTST